MRTRGLPVDKLFDLNLLSSQTASREQATYDLIRSEQPPPSSETLRRAGRERPEDYLLVETCSATGGDPLEGMIASGVPASATMLLVSKLASRGAQGTVALNHKGKRLQAADLRAAFSWAYWFSSFCSSLTFSWRTSYECWCRSMETIS